MNNLNAMTALPRLQEMREESPHSLASNWLPVEGNAVHNLHRTHDWTVTDSLSVSNWSQFIH